jgi:hypothetical protein
MLFACHDLAALSARDGALATRRRTTLASDNNIFAYEYDYVLVPGNSILNVTFGRNDVAMECPRRRKGARTRVI